MAQGSTRGIPIDTDNTLSANSNLLVSSQQAVKTYVDNAVNNIVSGTQNARATRLELTSDINLPISVTGSVSVVDFDNTVFNVDPTVFTNDGAGTVTCTLAGNYLITTSIVLESPLVSAITKSELGIRKNGTAIVCATTDDNPIALGNNVRSLTTSTIINLAANDTLQAVVNLFGASATGRGLRLPSLFGTTATQVSNISIERLEVSEFDVDATPTDGSSNAVSSNGVFDALALTRKLIVSNSGNNSVTGTTTETIIVSLEIPANSFDALCEIFVNFDYGKSTASGIPIKLYHNTSNSLSGATQIGLYNTGSNRNGGFNRKMKLRDTTLDSMTVSGLSQISNEFADNGFVPTLTLTIDPTSIMYFLITVTNDLVGTVFNHKTSKVEKLKL